MCGIFGSLAIEKKQIDINIIKKAINTLSHRGPEESGIAKLDNVVIGHRRLSIIDLKSNAAKQPVLSPNSLLAYNGMIYNFLELREELSISNTFTGVSDTEVLAKSLNHWGLSKTLKKIDGMFAFVWYCKKKREIYLVRDGLGEKPLYWAKANNRIYFSSEIKAFFEIKDFSRKPNVNNIDDYLYTSKVNGSKTIYSEINEVEPGSIITISTITGSISSNFYFSIESTFNKKSLSKNKIESLSNYMEESLVSRSISDVPLGVLLSGGIDSSLILNFLLKNDSINKINCYFANTKNKKLSEVDDVHAIVNFLKEKYKSKKIKLFQKKNSFSNYINLLIKGTKAFDEPVHFSNTPDLFNLIDLAKKDGLKVLLSGEGADELFFGYNRFIRSYEFLKNNKSKKLAIEEMYYGGGKHSIDCIKKICEPIRNIQKKSTSWIWLEKNINKYPLEDLIPMFSQKFRLQTLLQRQDRIGMVCGLEVRVPFLSQNLVKFGNSLPLKDKFNKQSNTSKLILKLMSKKKKLLPSKIIKKKKIGFNTDMIDWIKNDNMRELLTKMTNDKNGFINGYLDGKNAREIINLHFDGKRRLDTLVWNIFALELWHRVCGEGDNSFF